MVCVCIQVGTLQLSFQETRHKQKIQDVQVHFHICLKVLEHDSGFYMVKLWMQAPWSRSLSSVLLNKVRLKAAYIVIFPVVA